MKLRTATPASAKSSVKKALLVFVVLLVAVVTPIQISQSVSADPYDDKIRALQEDINKYQAEATRLNGEAKTLQSALATLAAEKAQIQAQLDLSQAKYDKLVIDIATTKQKIKDNQDALGETIANLYVDDKISPLEMIASSKNISDYLDKQEYRNSVRDELTSTIAEIKALKAKLDAQKVEVEQVLVQQKSQKEILVAKETEQQVLLDKTQGQEAAFQQLSSQKTAELQAAHEQQRAAIARLTNNGTNSSGTAGSFQFRNFSGNQGSCGGGYPSLWCSAPLDAYIDEWSLYTRECVSYTAWAASDRFNKKVTSFMGSGHAYQWPSTALSMGANVDNSPEVGSVAIAPISGYTPLGHSMMVEEVYGDGWIRVSQYNFAGTGEYSTMDLKVSSAVYVHFQNL